MLYPTFAVAADKATEAMIAAESLDNGLEPSSSSASSSTTAPFPAAAAAAAAPQEGGSPAGGPGGGSKRPPPSDDEVVRVLRTARLGHLLSRYQQQGAAAHHIGQRQQRGGCGAP